MKKLLFLSTVLVISLSSFFISRAQGQGITKPSANYSVYLGNPDTDSALFLVQTPKSTHAYLRTTLASVRNFVNIATYTSGSTYTVPANTKWVTINPASTQASLTITMPPTATASDGQEVYFSFGGTLTSGTVITALTISANSGQSLVQVAPTTGVVGPQIGYRFRKTTTIWYRIQ
jgi:hypothetical protein